MATFKDIDLQLNGEIFSRLQAPELEDPQLHKVCFRLVSSCTQLVKWLFYAANGNWDSLVLDTYPRVRKMIRTQMDQCYIVKRRKERFLVLCSLHQLWRYLHDLSEEIKAENTWSTEGSPDLFRWGKLLDLAEQVDRRESTWIQQLDVMDPPLTRVEDKVTIEQDWAPLELTEEKTAGPTPPTPAVSEADDDDEEEVKELADPEVIYIAGNQNVNDPVFSKFLQWDIREREDNSDTPDKQAAREKIMQNMLTVEETKCFIPPNSE